MGRMDKRNRGRPRRYHWPELLASVDGPYEFSLTRGEDFSCTVESLVQQIRNHASSRGLSICVSVGEGMPEVVTVTVQHAGRYGE